MTAHPSGSASDVAQPFAGFCAAHARRINALVLQAMQVGGLNELEVMLEGLHWDTVDELKGVLGAAAANAAGDDPAAQEAALAAAEASISGDGGVKEDISMLLFLHQDSPEVALHKLSDALGVALTLPEDVFVEARISLESGVEELERAAREAGVDEEGGKIFRTRLDGVVEEFDSWPDAAARVLVLHPQGLPAYAVVKVGDVLLKAFDHGTDWEILSSDGTSVWEPVWQTNKDASLLAAFNQMAGAESICRSQCMFAPDVADSTVHRDEHGRDYVTRYVVTVPKKDGPGRTLFGAAQGRNTHGTVREAQDFVEAVLRNNSGSTLDTSVGRDLQVRPCPCYPGHFDPMGVYFDSPSTEDLINPVIRTFEQKVMDAFVASRGARVVYGASVQTRTRQTEVYHAHSGQEAVLVWPGATPNPEKRWSEDALPFYRLRFDDGVELDAFAEEVFSHDERFLALQSVILGGFALAREVAGDFTGPYHLARSGGEMAAKAFLQGWAALPARAENPQVPWAPDGFKRPAARQKDPAPGV